MYFLIRKRFFKAKKREKDKTEAHLLDKVPVTATSAVAAVKRYRLVK